MKNYLRQIIILIFGCGTIIIAQSNIKWEETFNELTPPEHWQIIDADNSGEGFSFVQNDTTADGTILTPQTGQSFWVSNLQNCNRAGVIDEWLISPRLSVIYEGDSLYFWAGSIGYLFHDSIKVKVSTTNSEMSSFQYELGYFKVDGPAESWHQYGFDLSEFDGMDIYIAINYYILDGGPGGAQSDHIWIDHPIITGDPATINSPPTICSLKFPADTTYLDPSSQIIDFEWSASQDLDGDDLEYTLSIVNVFPQMHYSGLNDTILSLNWKELLNEYTPYYWTVEVSDGKSYVAAQDTFAFIIGNPADVLENNSEIPDKYSLCQNYPNPFNPSTVIKYGIPDESNVTLKVFDVLGGEIATLVNKEQPIGNYEVEFDASTLTSGIYFYRIQVYAPGRAGDFVDTKKMLLLK